MYEINASQYSENVNIFYLFFFFFEFSFFFLNNFFF